MEEGGKLVRGAGWERVQGTGHQRDKGALASTLAQALRRQQIASEGGELRSGAPSSQEST